MMNMPNFRPPMMNNFMRPPMMISSQWNRPQFQYMNNFKYPQMIPRFPIPYQNYQNFRNYPNNPNMNNYGIIN